jgi:hypothetical protein
MVLPPVIAFVNFDTGQVLQATFDGVAI